MANQLGTELVESLTSLILEGASDIILNPGNTTRWTVNTSGHIVPAADVTSTLGTSTNRISELWSSQVRNTGNLTLNAGGVLLTDTSDVLYCNFFAATGQIRQVFQSQNFNGSAQILLGTSDGSDDESLGFSGGGAIDPNRGANMFLYGEDHASLPGVLDIVSGTSGSTRFFTGGVTGTPRWVFNSVGDLIGYSENSHIYLDDNASTLQIAAATSAEVTSGAYLDLRGNSFAGGAEGFAQLISGNAANANVALISNSGSITMSTNGSQRWSVNNAGDFLPTITNVYSIGTSSLNCGAVFSVQFLSTQGPVLNIGALNNVNVQLYSAGHHRMTITSGGLQPAATSTYDLGTSALRWRDIFLINNPNVSSDERLKENVSSMVSSTCLSKVTSLNPVSFSYKSGFDSSGNSRIGFLAQEVYAHIPEAVSQGDSNELLEWGDEGFESWGLKSAELIPHLVGAIKELKTLLDAIDTRVTALENP